MSALSDAIAQDLQPLGALAARATAYVLRSEGEGILDEIHGRGKELALALSGGWGHPRPVLAGFGDGDEATLERLGRLYAAAAKRGVIATLGGDLRWVEHLIWEAGQNAPNTLGSSQSVLRLDLVARRMADTAPLVRAMLGRTTEFSQLAFAKSALGAPDVGPFLAANHEAVEAVLREGDPRSIEHLDETGAPVAPFAAVLADFASDSRVTLRRPALKMLARDPDAARAALRAVAGDDERRPKERELAGRALEMLAAPTAAEQPAPAELRVPPMTEDAKAKLRALLDQWHAEAVPKFAAHAARYPQASSSWIDPIDDATFARVVEDAERAEPWPEALEPILVRITVPYVVAIDYARVQAALADPDFAPVHVARILARIRPAATPWFVSDLMHVLGMRRDRGAPCSFADAADAVRYAGAAPGLIEQAVLQGSGWGDEADAAFLAEHPETLEVVFGGRAATWFDPSAHTAGLYRRTAFDRVRAMAPGSVGERGRAALLELALRGSKTDRAHAQACLVHLGGWEELATAALRDGTAEVRANAATWIARAKLPARDELRRALAKEKNDAARVAIMEALEAAGEPLDALMNRDALLAGAAKVLAKAKCPVLEWPELGALPRVHWADTNAPVDAAIVRAWIAETYKAKNPAASPLLRLYARTIRQGEREAFARALLDAWITHDTAQEASWSSTAGYTSASSAVAEKGVLALVAAFGSSGIADRVGSFLRTHYGVRAAQCKALLQMLAHVDDKAATQLLLATATRFRTAGIRAEAEAQAKALAERRGWTVDEMADRTIPTGGLDDGGTLSLSYGEGARAFFVRVDPSLRITLHASDGAVIKGLPAPHKDEDADSVKGAKASFARAKKEIEAVVKMQRARLYEAMCTQRTWRFEDWDALLAKHPIVRHVVCGVVWVGGVEGSAEETSFRPLGDGSLSTADGREVKLPPDAIVRVAHPLTMHDAHVGDWAEHLGDFEVLPLFLQFGRPARVVGQDAATAKECRDFVGHMIEAFKLRGAATALGWTRGPAEDGGWFYRYVKLFPSLGLRGVLSFSGNALPEENRTVALGAFCIERAGADVAVPLGEIPRVLYSEVYDDVADLARAGTGYDAAWESKVR